MFKLSEIINMINKKDNCSSFFEKTLGLHEQYCNSRGAVGRIIFEQSIFNLIVHYV